MCEIITHSLEKDSKLDLIPKSESSSSSTDPIDALNQQWLLSSVHNEPLLLINLFFRDSSLLTNEMLSLILTRSIYTYYRTLNNNAESTPGKLNAVVTLLGLYSRNKNKLMITNEIRELYLQLLNNTWKQVIDGFGLVWSSRISYINMIAGLIKSEPTTEVFDKLRSLLLKGYLNLKGLTFIFVFYHFEFNFF